MTTVQWILIITCAIAALPPATCSSFSKGAALWLAGLLLVATGFGYASYLEERDSPLIVGEPAQVNLNPF